MALIADVNAIISQPLSEEEGELTEAARRLEEGSYHTPRDAAPDAKALKAPTCTCEGCAKGLPSTEHIPTLCVCNDCLPLRYAASYRRFGPPKAEREEQAAQARRQSAEAHRQAAQARWQAEAKARAEREGWRRPKARRFKWAKRAAGALTVAVVVAVITLSAMPGDIRADAVDAIGRTIGWQGWQVDSPPLSTDPPGVVPAAVYMPTPTPTPTVPPTPTAPSARRLLPFHPTATPPVAMQLVAAAPIPTTQPTPSPTPSQRHLEQKQYMLDLINQARADAGVPGVVLGDNEAAQLHAEAMLEQCFMGHWGIDGLKPYMRYSLAGGYQNNGENVSGSNYCDPRARHYGIKSEIRETMDGFLSSPGHRKTLLDPLYTKVNIGLAWAPNRVNVVQQFEGDYIQYEKLPVIEDGVLRMHGRLLHGATFTRPADMSVSIYYDPLPHRLTRGQVARTYCYNRGKHAASLRPPLGASTYYTSGSFTYT